MELLFTHFTDMHIENEKDYDVILSRSESLINVICKHIMDKENTVVIMCITGDIAYSGKEDEYIYASLFIQTIIEGIKARYNKINLTLVSVPGNHDCDFECSENIVRSQLLKSEGLDILKPEIVKIGTSIQKEFWKFAKEWDNESGLSAMDNTIITENTLSFKDKTLKFHCINTAWCSNKNEKKGSMKFAVPNLPEKSQDDIVITLMHHEEGWFDWDDKEIWKEYYQKYSDIVFMGHDHAAEFIHRENYDSVSNYFIKGNQFYASKNPNVSGFNILKVDLVNNIQYFYTYIWNDHLYENIIDTKARTFKRNRFINSGIELKKEVFDYIEDIEINIISKYRNILHLSDIYAFPRLRGNGQNEKIVYKDKEEIIDFIKTNKYVEINGDKEFGKTALLKQLFKVFYERKYYPVFINVGEINSSDGEMLNTKIAEFYCKDYNNLEPELIMQMEPEKKVCIIDNFEEISMSDKSIKKFLEYLKDKFGIVIITTNQKNEIKNFLNLIETNEYIKDKFERLSMTELRSYGKAKLVDKWLLLEDEEQNTKSLKFDAIRKSKLSQVESVMKNGYFNRTPIEFLLVLSYLDNAEKMSNDYSRYSYIYDCLIMDRINDIADRDTNEASMYMTILQQLAFKMYEDKKNLYIDEEYILKVIGDYNQEYSGTKGKMIDTIQKLVNYKILECKDIKYKFKYNYMYYYFVGNYIKDQLSPDKKDDMIRIIFSDLSKEINYNIGLFLAYSFSTEYDILPKIVEISNGLLSEFQDFKYEEQKELIRKLDFEIEKKVEIIFVPKNDDIPELQEQNRLINDDIEENLIENTENDLNDEFEKINEDFIKLLRIIEFSGNILKNYSSKIKRVPRMEIIGLMNTSTLKLIGFLCNSMEDTIDKVIEIVNEKIKDEEDGEKVKSIFLQKIKSFVGQMWKQFIEVNISNLSYCLECDRISNDISDFKTEISSNFFDMVNVEYLIRIAHDKLPVSEIEACFKGKNKLDSFSQRALKQNIYNYLINYQYDNKDKQSICSTLGFDIRQMYLEEQRSSAISQLLN